jgi:MFS family permease
MNSYVVITAIAFILFMANGITGPVSSLYAESLGASYVAIGLLGTVTSLTTIVFSYIWGHASDLFRRRKPFLMISLAILATSNGLVAVVPSYGYLFPLRILAAVAHAAYGTTSLALMGDLLEQRSEGRGRRMGLFRGLCSLGFGMMAFVSGTIADRLSIRVPFGLAAGFLGIAFLLSFGIKESFSDHSPMTLNRAHLRAFWHSLANSTRNGLQGVKVWLSRSQLKVETVPSNDEPPRLPLTPLLVSALLWSLVTGAVYAVWANYMVSQVGYSPSQMTKLWALASTTEFPLMILAGWLSDRIGRLPMLSLGFLAWAVVFLGYVFVPGMPWIVFVQLTRGFAYSAFTATAMTYATEVRAKSERGWASGLYNSAGGLGSILGSSVGGALTQLTGFRTMFATNASIILGGAVYLAVVAIRRASRVKSSWKKPSIS